MFVDSRRVAPFLVLILAAGCTCGGTPASAPRLDAVDPAWTFDTVATPITLNGEMFTPRGSLPLGVGPEALKTDATFRAFLGELELSNVVWHDSKTITADVPAGLEVGSYTVRLEDPYGVRVALADAFEVRTRRGAALSTKVTASESTVRLGSSVRIDVTITNDGDTAARDVVVLADQPMGTALVMQLGILRGNPVIEPGASQVSSFTFGTSMVGVFSVSAHASGQDSTSLAALVSPAATSPMITVLSPPLIEGTASVMRPTSYCPSRPMPYWML